MSINIQIGRIRVHSNTKIHEAAYAQNMREQVRLIVANMKSITNGVHDLTPEAIRFGLQPMFDESQRLVPKDTLKLMHSGFLEVRKTTKGAEASMGYGRNNHPFYTIFVHERLDVAHKAPTQAKFLEAAINKHMGRFLPRVKQYIKQQGGL